MNQVISLSGGKDSTATALMMVEKGEKIHSAVFFDTGWEFPSMYDHLDKLEAMVDFPIVRLKPDIGFDHWMFERRVKAKRSGLSKLNNKELGYKWKHVRDNFHPDLGPAPRTKAGRIEGLHGKVHRIGNGWPSPMRRWCTRQKVNAINRYAKGIPNIVQCIGFAYDEPNRYENITTSMEAKCPSRRFPLVEYKMTEADALEYCKSKGFDWGGLYDVFGRVSCFCCPLQRIGELRKLRENFPDLWDRMLTMDSNIPGHNRGFKDYKTVHDFEKRFSNEDRQMILFE